MIDAKTYNHLIEYTKFLMGNYHLADDYNVKAMIDDYLRLGAPKETRSPKEPELSYVQAIEEAKRVNALETYGLISFSQKCEMLAQIALRAGLPGVPNDD